MTAKPMAAALPAFEGRAATEKRHPLGWLKREAKRRPVYVAAAFFLAVAVFTALTGPMWPLLADPKEPALGDRLLAPFSSGGEGRYYLAGSDNLGRDIFARTVTGARASIGIAALVVVVAGVCGTAIGLLAGYAGGKVDLVVMRAVDLQIAFPSLVLAIFLLYLVGNSMTNLVLLLVLLSWAGFARIARAETLSIRNQQFVEGAVAIGATEPAGDGAAHRASPGSGGGSGGRVRLFRSHAGGGQPELPRVGRPAARQFVGPDALGRPGVRVHRRVVVVPHPGCGPFVDGPLREPDVALGTGTRSRWRLNQCKHR